MDPLMSGMEGEEEIAARLRTAAVLQQVPVGITILRGPTFIAEMANDAYLQIIDRTHEQFVGKSLFDSLPEVRTAVEPLLSKVLTSGVPYYGNEFEVTINRYGKKEQTFFNFVYQPVVDPDGVIRSIAVVANEVTEQVRARQILTESEKQFRNMVAQSPIAMTILKGHDMIIDIANETLLRNIWRRELKEVQGKSIFDAFPELKDQKYPDLLLQVYDTGKAHRELDSVAYVDGGGGMKKFYLDFEYAPLSDTSGKVMGIFITVYDVTERAETRERITEQAERLRLATEATHLATWDLDLLTSEIVYNERLVEIFGADPGAPLSHRALRDYVVPEDRKNIVEKAFEEALRTGAYFYEARILAGDQSLRWIRTFGKVFFDSAKRPVRMIGTVTDITDAKLAADALRSFSEELEKKVEERTHELTVANEELEKMNRELASFAYVSSHDLQEPLRKIQTFSSFLLDSESDRLSEKGKDYLDRMDRAANRMQQLIQDILAYSRNTDKSEPLVKVDLNTILEETREDLKESIAEKKAVIESAVLPVIDGIHFQLAQLFANLLSNSIKFSRPEAAPHISIRTRLVRGEDIGDSTAVAGKNYHEISFTDNGIGFQQQYSTRIFEVFQRLHARAVFEGTGIGLAICKRITDNHSGFITATGHPGEGSVFYVYFPVTA